ncbi:MAG: glycosyl transferase [Bacteroidetes bacterium GWA2_30_7]|nr:MAG: glycosyl transferase [Bacteroidetes bacterium GWA2_30_7]
MQKVKFLIIRFSSIGDIVLTTPVIRGIKQQVENAEVHFLTKTSYSSVLQANPYIDKIHLFDNNFDELVETLKNEYFDYIIDLHHNLRSYRIKKSLGILAISFDKLNFKKWLYVNFKINKLPNQHIVDRYLQTVKLFDVVNDNLGLDYFIPTEDEVNIKDFYPEIENDFVVLVVGAKHFTKQIPINIAAEICKKLNTKIVILGGKEDSEKAEKIIQLSEKNVFNLCGKLNINQSASIIKQSKLIITSDTGLMHIAAAFKKYIISVWGNTVPEFGMYPYLAKELYEIIEVKNLKCRPCSKIGFSQCPKKHFKCMNNIDVDRIVLLSDKIKV